MKKKNIQELHLVHVAQEKNLNTAMVKLSKKIKENRELNKGEKERRGIVRLRSDSLIDLRNNNAENIPKIIKTMPGIK